MSPAGRVAHGANGRRQQRARPGDGRRADCAGCDTPEASPACLFRFCEFEPRPRIIAHCHDHDARHREATTSLRDTLRARAQEQASQTWRSASKSSGELGMVEQQIHELRRSVERGGAAIVAKPIAAELNA